MRVMIDTQIWVIAKKKPSPNRFPSQREYEEALRAHEHAREFLLEEHAKARIYMSAHQLAEIYHALAFRGFRVPLTEARAFIEGVATDPNIYIVPVTPEHYRSAVDESARTDIHVWDYLCLLPVLDYVETVYSTDPHFQVLCRDYGLKLVNPIGYWSETQP